MFRRPLTVVFAITAITALTVAPAHAGTDSELALHWAPVHYQDTDSSDYDADYLSTVDFDADWDAKNNWEHRRDGTTYGKLEAAVTVAHSDGVVYLPATTAEVPSSGNDRAVNYRLVDVFASGGLWARIAPKRAACRAGVPRGRGGSRS